MQRPSLAICILSCFQTPSQRSAVAFVDVGSHDGTGRPKASHACAASLYFRRWRVTKGLWFDRIFAKKRVKLSSPVLCSDMTQAGQSRYLDSRIWTQRCSYGSRCCQATRPTANDCNVEVGGVQSSRPSCNLRTPITHAVAQLGDWQSAGS